VAAVGEVGAAAAEEAVGPVASLEAVVALAAQEAHREQSRDIDRVVEIAGVHLDAGNWRHTRAGARAAHRPIAADRAARPRGERRAQVGNPQS
jgi:hypothetical protein